MRAAARGRGGVGVQVQAAACPGVRQNCTEILERGYGENPGESRGRIFYAEGDKGKESGFQNELSGIFE